MASATELLERVVLLLKKPTAGGTPLPPWPMMLKKMSVAVTVTALLLMMLSTVQGQTPELVMQTGHSSWVFSVAFSPDGRLLASGSGDQTIKLWDVANGTELRSLRGHTYTVQSVAFSPNGQLLVSLSGDNEIKLWDVLQGTAVWTIKPEITPKRLPLAPMGWW